MYAFEYSADGTVRQSLYIKLITLSHYAGNESVQNSFHYTLHCCCDYTTVRCYAFASLENIADTFPSLDEFLYVIAALRSWAIQFYY